MLNEQNVISVVDLRKNYKDFEAVRGISFEVRKGEIFGILGPNGAGKSTTLEIMEGLRIQSAGTCVVLGYDNLKNSSDIKKRIGVQLQTSEYLNNLNLSELLRLFASLYKLRINPIEVLSKVGLEDKAKSYIKHLSGGQKQRFTVATAIVHDPEILFLDEPTTGLDPQARREMWDLIKKLNADSTTIVLTTHYMEEAEYLCNRVAIMDSGQILKLDTPQKLIEASSKIYNVSFFTEKRIDPAFFDGIPDIIKTVIEHPKVIVEISSIHVLSAIVEKLKTSQTQYSFLNLKTATLEDVYLQLTGKEYEG